MSGPASMAPGTPFFDLLDDQLVQQVITALPAQRRRSSRRHLSETCRRMCTLVRRFARVRVIQCAPDVLRLARVPAARAFSNVVSLQLGTAEGTDPQGWATYIQATAAAAAAWPGLKEVRLTGGCGADEEACEPGWMSGALLALQPATALRCLELAASNPYSLAFAPLLTQLTSLVLRGLEEPIVLTTGLGARPLALMSQLVVLELFGAQLPLDGPCALPPNLTWLMLGMVFMGTHGSAWEHHVAGCRQLQDLVLVTHNQDLYTHPSLVMQSLAGQQMTQLRKLCMMGQDVEAAWSHHQQDEIYDLMYPDPGSDGSDHDGERLSQPPLGPDQGWEVPEAHTVLPPPNMGGLSTLQLLAFDTWWLVLTAPRHWRALAACCQLHTLAELHVTTAPPAGVTFPGVTLLEVTTSTSPGDTLALLAAFPVLQQLELGVVMQACQDNANQPPSAGATILQRATSAAVVFHKAPRLTADSLRSSVRAYCRALWGALPCLQQLELKWAAPVQLLSHVFSLSALQQLTALRLGARTSRGGSECTGLEPQQVVGLVQGATQLQAVTLYKPLAPGSSKDQLVLGLQGSLPLKQLEVLDGLQGLTPATLGALRPGLTVRDIPGPGRYEFFDIEEHEER